jgi:predicted amidohydrolase YtcJ
MNACCFRFGATVEARRSIKQFHARLEEGWREPYSSASALKGGLRPTLHSDWNVIAIGPLRMAENAVTRTMHHGGDVLNPAEKAPVEAALRMVTADAAWQCRQEQLLFPWKQKLL